MNVDDDIIRLLCMLILYLSPRTRFHLGGIIGLRILYFVFGMNSHSMFDIAILYVRVHRYKLGNGRKIFRRNNFR